MIKKQSALSARSIRQAEKHLSQSCVVMANLIATHGRCSLANREFRPFQTLVNSIISQQLSSKAADAIKNRLINILSNFTPTAILNVSDEALRKAGLSAAKVRYIREVAIRVNDGSLNFDLLAQKPDKEVTDTLIKLPGIGPWTAEMFLIFGLKRPNVLSTGDTGLQRAVRLLFGKKAKIEIISNRWQPYCSVASWYLWKFLDTPQ